MNKKNKCAVCGNNKTKPYEDITILTKGYPVKYMHQYLCDKCHDELTLPDGVITKVEEKFDFSWLLIALIITGIVIIIYYILDMVKLYG